MQIEIETSRSLSNSVLAAIIAVLEAKTRIFIDTDKTFFSTEDQWLYIEISDDRLCDRCQDNAKTDVYKGDHLRADFPYLEIRDENTIAVNEHPNCRCIFVRVARKAPVVKPEEEPPYDKKLMNKAKDYYGTTKNWHKAGWILPDGKMLDFRRDTVNRRDHQDIAIVAGYGDDMNPVRNFQDEGAIRIDASEYAYRDKPTSILSFSITIEGDPSDSAWNQLKDIAIDMEQHGQLNVAFDIYSGKQEFPLTTNYATNVSSDYIDEVRSKMTNLQGRETKEGKRKKDLRKLSDIIPEDEKRKLGKRVDLKEE
jgi:hypothetical protein